MTYQQPPAQPYTLVAMLGPDGVGKTTLARALASMLARTERGASAPRTVQSNGYAAEVFEFRGMQGVYQVVDFANNAAEHALISTARFSCAILAISALDGILPATLRSVEHARECGIPRLVVALTRCDQIDDVELLDLVEVEVREMANKYHFGGDRLTVARCSAGSALAGHGAADRTLAQLADGVDGVGG